MSLECPFSYQAIMTFSACLKQTWSVCTKTLHFIACGDHALALPGGQACSVMLVLPSLRQEDHRLEARIWGTEQELV